jgi:hypothetical protein
LFEIRVAQNILAKPVSSPPEEGVVEVVAEEAVVVAEEAEEAASQLAHNSFRQHLT